MANYVSEHTGAQLDSAVKKANNPENVRPAQNSQELITSGAVFTGVQEASNKIKQQTLAGLEFVAPMTEEAYARLVDQGAIQENKIYLTFET